MNDQQNLFSEFEGISKEGWIEKIKTDLKGRPFEDLDWQIDEALLMPPISHSDDAINAPKMQFPLAVNNDWQIGEFLKVKDAKVANALALEALAKGANALRVQLPDDFDQMEALLKDIQLDYISLHIVTSKPDLALLEALTAFASAQSANLSSLEGSWTFKDPNYSDPQLAQFLKSSYQQLPRFKGIKIALEKPAQQLSELSKAVRLASEALHQLGEQGIGVEQIASQLQFSAAVGKQYFVELARFRAIHLLWANLLEAYGGEARPAAMEAYTDPRSYVEDLHSNMISTTTQAMSAILGGVERLYVLPANINTAVPNAFTSRVARNLQHLLKMESYLDRVVDPAAGSYYIEALTRKMAEHCWKALAAS